jgi:hypothetical protein
VSFVDPSIRPDDAMLLRLIDAKFANTDTKIDGVSATLKVMNDRFVLYDNRFDDHEHRIGAVESTMAARQLMIADFVNLKSIVKNMGDAITGLEKWQTKVKTTTTNASRWGSMIWNIIGGGVTAGLLFLATLYFQTQPQAVEHKAVEQTTTTVTGQR